MVAIGVFKGEVPD